MYILRAPLLYRKSVGVKGNVIFNGWMTLLFLSEYFSVSVFSMRSLMWERRNGWWWRLFKGSIFGTLLITHARCSFQGSFEMLFWHAGFFFCAFFLVSCTHAHTGYRLLPSLKRNNTLYNLTPSSVRLMRVSCVISWNVVEKFWTPTHRPSYTTVNSNHAEKLASKHPSGSYL